MLRDLKSGSYHLEEKILVSYSPLQTIATLPSNQRSPELY